MTRLIMQILRVPEEIAKIILGYIPVRRLTRRHLGSITFNDDWLPHKIANPNYLMAYGRLGERTNPKTGYLRTYDWGYLQ